MRANVNKFEGLRLGRLKGKEPPANPEYRTNEIAWQQPGQYVRVLGIPFWEGDTYDPREFWVERYSKMKAIISKWNNWGCLTLTGRRNIANSMIMGRFRYYVQSMHIPEEIVDWIDSDIQQFIWGKGDGLHVEEPGSDGKISRWMLRKHSTLRRARWEEGSYFGKGTSKRFKRIGCSGTATLREAHGKRSWTSGSIERQRAEERRSQPER